jgi:hypothetical protein
MLKEKIKNIVRNIVYPQRTILGRIACLGQEIFKIKYSDTRNLHLINQQKTRADLLLQWIRGEMRPDARSVEAYMLRKDVFPFIEQQQLLPWMNVKKFEHLVMDSFAELTDQKFTHKEKKWSFCCHYTDIDHTPEFEKEFECHGLLPLEKIEEAYNLFFQWFETRYPGKKIYFIHYPTKLDTRAVFKERGAKILQIMKKIEHHTPYIQNMYVDDTIVNWHSSDTFPYHYSSNVNIALADQWKELEKNDNP